MVHSSSDNDVRGKVVNTTAEVHICSLEIPASGKDSATVERLAESLPVGLQKAINRKRYRKHRVVRAAGWLLLQHQLVQNGYDANLLTEVQTTRFGKPFIPGAFNFSLSYTGNFAVCAVADINRLGVDIEIAREIELYDFSRYFNDTEWHTIVRSEDPQKSFFLYWTRKESVLKADGRGLSVDLRDVSVNATAGRISDSSIQYYLYRLPAIGDKVAASFCSDQQNIQLAVKRVDVAFLTSIVRVSPFNNK